MAYESPIRLVTEIENKIIEDQREGVYKAVLAYKIDISKDELFKLLYGDRKQYEKGFADGYAKGTADANAAQAEAAKQTIEKFRDYQIEWLTAHHDIEFCEEEENEIISFLKDTAAFAIRFGIDEMDEPEDEPEAEP